MDVNFTVAGPGGVYKTAVQVGTKARTNKAIAIKSFFMAISVWGVRLIYTPEAQQAKEIACSLPVLPKNTPPVRLGPNPHYFRGGNTINGRKCHELRGCGRDHPGGVSRGFVAIPE